MSAQPIEAVHDWLDSRPRATQSGRKLPTRPSAPRMTLTDAWQLDAACRDVPAATSDAFTDATTQADGELLAASWCAACPVAEACLTVGRETWGWGLHGGLVLIHGKVAPRTTENLRPRLELVDSALEDVASQSRGLAVTSM